MAEEMGINKIDDDKALFLRDEPNPDAINRYAEKYESGGLDALPPLIIQEETLKLIDGFHRKMALDRIGSRRALVEEIETGNPRAEAVRRNIEHGVPLSREERDEQIKKLYDEGFTQSEIGEIFGLTRSAISKILNISDVKNSRTNISQVLKERFVKGLAQEEVADSYGISQPTVSQKENDFKDRVAEKFLKVGDIEGVRSWIQEEHDFELGGEKLEETLSKHDSVPSCLVEDGNIDLDGLKVRFEDCLVALDDLKKGSIDCVVTDPPYGIQFNGQRYRNLEFGEIENDEDMETAVHSLPKIERAMKEDAHAYVFTRWDVYPFIVQNIPDGLELSNLLVWNKGKGGHGMGDLGNYAPQYELIMLLEKGDRKINGDRPSNVLEYDDIRFTGEEKYISTQKPKKLIRFLIEKSTDKGETVLDPFLGSGTTALASYELDREFVGYEIDSEENEGSIKRRILGVYDE